MTFLIMNERVNHVGALLTRGKSSTLQFVSRRPPSSLGNFLSFDANLGFLWRVFLMSEPAGDKRRASDEAGRRPFKTAAVGVQEKEFSVPTKRTPTRTLHRGAAGVKGSGIKGSGGKRVVGLSASTPSPGGKKVIFEDTPRPVRIPQGERNRGLALGSASSQTSAGDAICLHL